MTTTTDGVSYLVHPRNAQNRQQPALISRPYMWLDVGLAGLRGGGRGEGREGRRLAEEVGRDAVCGISLHHCQRMAVNGCFAREGSGTRLARWLFGSGWYMAG